MSGSAIAALIGLVAGLLSGMFGIGGGLVTTPAIRLLLGYPALIAVGTPLPVIIPTALAGAAAYARRGLVDARAGVLIGLAGSVTSVAGAYAADLLGGPVVMIVTAVVILYVTADMVIAARREPDRVTAEPTAEATLADGTAAPVSVATSRAVLVGLVAGLYSGLLGLGGGAIVVPVLVRWMRMPVKRAVGTSLVAVAVLAVPGTIAHAALGHVDAGLAMALALGVVPGALVGAKVTSLARDLHVRYGFAALLVVAGIALALNEVIA